ncbi:MAG: siderophore-interacting protein [Acidimicrobiia bacterium]|nr:siderophore-interacting protein [Acidimicrobiia bacterium]
MDEPTRIRREPPPFRRVAVLRAERLTGWMRRITLAGSELAALATADPAASVRLLLPGAAGLVMPEWNGNEFLLPDGTRPVIRTLTPRHQRPGELDVDVVLHDSGEVSGWARRAVPGEPVAVSGPGRGSAPDPGTGPRLIAGDQTAVPAIAQLLETMPAAERIDVLIEIGDPDDPAPLPPRPDTAITWLPPRPDTPPGTALVAAIRQFDHSADLRIWAAGEAAAMQQIRRHLADSGFPRPHTTVRGYWKHGKPAGGTAD